MSMFYILFFLFFSSSTYLFNSDKDKKKDFEKYLIPHSWIGRKKPNIRIYNDELFVLDDKNNRCLCSPHLDLLLKKGADPNSLDKFGFSLLYRAAQSGNTKFVASLLQYKAYVNLNTDFGTALHAIASLSLNFYNQTHFSIAMFLIKNGININLKDNNGFGDTALIEAARTGNIQLVDLLLKNGADVNLQGTTGETALLKATYLVKKGNGEIRKNHLEIIKLLLNANSNINIRDIFNKNFLDYSKTRALHSVLHMRP